MVLSPLLLDEPSRPTRAAWVAWGVGGGCYLAMAVVVATRSAAALRPLPWVAVTSALAMAIVAAVTAMLLYAHAVRSGGRGYVALTATFSTVCLLQLALPLAFPGAFVDDRLLGGPQSSIALFYLWHLVFLIGVPVSAVLLDRDARSVSRRKPVTGRAMLLLAVGPGLALVVWALLLPGLLPPLLTEDGITWLASALDRLVVLIAVTGLVLTAAVTRGRTAIGRWLIAVATLGLGGAIVNLGAERFSLGWYFNRTIGLLMMSMLLLALVWEFSRIARSAYDAAAYDAVTSATSRTVFLSELERAVSRATREGHALAVLWLDLDRFKLVNDQFGHHAGDEVLSDVAQRVRREIRDSDVLGRMGGDEFAVLLTGVGDPQSVEAVATRIADRLRLPFTLGSDLVSCPCSVGVSCFPQDAGTASELLAHADLAMYDAKQHGGSSVAHYEPRPDPSEQRLGDA